MANGDLVAVETELIAVARSILWIPISISTGAVQRTEPIVVVRVNLAGTLQVQPQFVSIVRCIVEASANGVDTRLGWTWIATGTVFYHALGGIAVKQAAAQLQPQAILYQRAGSIESEVLRVAGVAIFLEGGVYRH